MALTLHRLDRNQESSFVLYPRFERRVRDFLGVYSPELKANNQDRFMLDLSRRWIETPLLAGYWAITLGLEMVGHIASWVADHYGVPYVLLYQLEVDECGEDPRDVVRQAVGESTEWIRGLNQQLSANKAPTIDYVAHWTIRDPKAWKRWLPDLEQYTVLHEMRWRTKPGEENG